MNSQPNFYRGSTRMLTSFLQGTQECQQAEDFLSRTFLQEIGRFCASASKPSKDHQGQGSVLLHANHQRQKIFLRTLKCHLQRSWSHDPEDSKSKPMVQACKRQADGEPSLVVGRGHVSWTMLSLIALTRQKQLAKSRQAESQPASQLQACLFQDYLSRRNSRSTKASQKFSLPMRNGTARNKSHK